ncbi:oligosaccharide flippase family protein [Azohydromonas caseinilytica]|uniref:Oligosaccharide flippase family protein n=1 Tax=Azohydromonas caseinilytica TaxID=2728836 RepID=A0A848F8E8_9BURK|nr:oligosaccharide flippase family protein [Azohydromonas caseinilytica]NML15632.1 oligosaccharide flippase family protein [Azohydromonas caseinilytica]
MSIRKSLLITSIDRYVSLSITIVSTMVLARLLTPSEVGAFSVAMVLISVMSMMRGMGAGQYLVQEKEVTEDRMRAVWAVQLGLGVLMGLVVAGMAVPAAHFYKDERVRDILFVLAGNFLITPFGSVTYVWLMREMRFVPLALMQFAYTVTNAVVAIWLAWKGWGAISLAWGNLAATVANALVAMCFRPKGHPWMPGLREVPRVLSFGARVSTSALADTLSKGAPEFFLGNLQSLAAAGFYSRAAGLVSLFHRLVFDVASQVATTDFAKRSREAQDARAPFLLSMAHITVLCWAFSAFLALMAGPLIRVLYGAQWTTSAPLVSWLSAALAVSAPVALCLAALTGLGAAAQVLRAGMLSAAAAMLLALAGAYLGLQAVAVTALLSAALGTAWWLRSARQVVGFAWKELAAVLRRSAAVALAASIGPLLAVLVYGWAPEHTWTVLLLGGAGAAAGFLAGIAQFGHPLFDELRRLFGLWKGLSAKKS